MDGGVQSLSGAAILVPVRLLVIIGLRLTVVALSDESVAEAVGAFGTGMR